MTLSEIEAEVRGLHSGLCLRMPLDRAKQVGCLLLEAKKMLGHGQFLPWLAGTGVGMRSARVYMQVARAPAKVQSAAPLTLDQFLRQVRLGREAEQADRPDAPETRLRPDAELHHADCRSYQWPDAADCVVGDPPWDDDKAYDWLASFAAQKLRRGGLCFVQCGTKDLHRRYAPFIASGLVYHWTLAILYADTRAVTHVRGHFADGWRPVLCFSQGRPKKHEFTTDTYTVKKSEKHLHPWQQPLAPWRHWLRKMTPEGALVLDPYAGSGTVAVACVETGRRYVGTEIDPRHARVARDRIGRA